MKFKKSIARKAEQEQPLKFTQLIVRSLLFLLGFTLFWLAILIISNVAKEELFLSEIPIVYTWLISLLLVIAPWLLYLIFITGDNTFSKMLRNFKLYGAFGTPPDIGLKWWTVFIMMIVCIYFFQPSLYSNINALYHEIVFKGKAVLSEEEEQSRDKRFVRISVENRGEQYRFEGKAEQFGPLLNKEVHITVYQGLFFKYALVSQP
ncbi:Uncharacterised protein [Porphyromonas crevioricanis]|uniref:Uncharacterized protein n=1 Tax=Porphyromonas crevioricanis TaxID=393921 RepID=A0A2X4PIJ9_9PORP|nr:hypothetical protein [Porphyromonas crevioricanis]SQH72500.1 Uncharacterised protein [Porphyromonas crevioricanis]